MKILELKVEGFRSLKSVVWRPGDLNVVIGPNAGGKSNLLQLLEMIAASARGELAKFVKKQGGMQPIVWDGKVREIKFSISGKNHEKENLFALYELTINRSDENSLYFIDEEQLEFEMDNTHLSIRGRPHYMIKDGNNVHKAPENFFSDKESFLFFSSGFYIKNPFISYYNKYLRSWSIFSDFQTGKESSIRQSFITSFEKEIVSNGQNFVSVLHTLYEEDREFKKEINLAMQSAFGEDFEELSFPPAADGRTQLRIRWKSLNTAQSAANLSDGTLRFLYLLTILAHPEPPALIAIDEPETGLHPSMISIIAEYAVESARKTQVIITTHSPEFLGAFRDTQPTTTVCEWHDGQTQLRVLSGEKLDYWLKDYILGELFKSGELEGME